MTGLNGPDTNGGVSRRRPTFVCRTPTGLRAASVVLIVQACATPQSLTSAAPASGSIGAPHASTQVAASTAKTTPGTAAKPGAAATATSQPANATNGEAKPNDDKNQKKDTPKWDVQTPPGDWGWKDVKIDTTEGTWISVDVSPDGKTVVFDLLGDLYTVPISGGDAKAIRKGIAWHMQPRFSPDGSKIAFTSDAGNGDNLWVMNLDGSEPRQVTNETFRLINNPAWDPTSEYLVGKKHFTSKRSLGAGEMWMFHISGGSGVQMTKRPNEQKDVNDPAFSPDGHYLYYDRDATPGRYFQYNKDSSTQIYVIERLDRQTGEVTRVAGGPGGAARPTPSPDGRWLAFTRRVDYTTVLFLRDLKSGAERPLYTGLERDNQEVWALHGVYPGMAWTPDARSIVFWDDGHIKRIDITSGRVFEIPFRVQTIKKVAAVVRPPQQVAPDRFDVKMLRSVTVSPRGDRVAYVALGHVWTKALPKGTPRRLTSTGNDRFEHHPSFSADGRSVVFATWNDKTLGDLRVASVRGGRPRVITRRPGHYAHPKFSPDGKTVVFQRTGAGYLRDPRFSDEPGIYRISTRGGTAERLTTDGQYPHFGRRSDRIFFMRANGDETSDTRKLIALDLKTRKERELYSSGSAQAYVVSPDSRWLAFRDGFKVYIAPFNEVGRTVSIGPKSKSVPVAKVAKHAGDYLSWSGDARSLYWALGAELYQRPLTDAFKYLDGAPEKLPEPPAQGTPIGFSVAADKPKGTIAFVGGRVITMKGDEVLSNGVVVVAGNRITAVGPADSTAIPAGALKIDVKGKTLIPGLIDAHAHGPFGTAGIIPQHNWSQFANLAFGVTTIHDPSNNTEMVFSASEMQRAGMIRAPRIYSTGRILYGAAGADYKASVESLDDAKFHLKRMQAVGGFSVKSYNQPRRDQRQMVMEAARQMQMQVMPEGGATFMHNMTMLVDGHTTIEHNLPVETIYEDVLQLWSASDTALTPTLVVSYGGISGEVYWYETMDVWRHERLMTYVPRYVVDPRSRRRQKAPKGDYNHIVTAKQLKALIDRGRLVNTGAHGQLAGLAEHWEIWMYVQGGMTEHEALRAATMNPAQTLGMEKDIGSIESGKLADIVVLDKNPLDDIKGTDSVAMVMLNGRLYDAATMDQIGNDIDDAGSKAFGTGKDALGIGKWWGSVSAFGPADFGCSCEKH